jgi:hypothetical protein
MFDPPETKKGYGLFVHSLFIFYSSACNEANKKAMGGLEAAHGLYFLIQMVMTAPGRPPSPCFPSTTNYLV